MYKRQGFFIDEFNQYKLKVGDTQGTCPLCSEERKSEHKNKKCASYDWERGLGTCHNCNETFQLHTFKRKGSVLNDYTRPDPDIKVELSDKSIEWFKSRGISTKTLNELKVTDGEEFMPQAAKKMNTIHFNYFIGGELVNIKYRDGLKNFKLFKGAEKVFYNIDNTVGYKDIVIVEGEIDALSIYEAGIKNVVSVPNGAAMHNNNLTYLDNCIDYFDDKERVILALDQDAPGEELKREFIRRLGAEMCYLVDLKDCKDANEYLQKYGAKELSKRVSECKQVPLENVVTLKDVEVELKEFVKTGFKPGYQVGLENFDRIFSTYTKQFITVTGIPSSGKSDFVDQMCIGYNRLYGWKTAFASPENMPTYLHAHKLMRKIWEKMPSKEDIGTEKWNNVARVVNDNFFFIDMERFSLDTVLKKGAELVKRKGIKCLVIDPFNKIRDIDAPSEDINKYTMTYLNKIEMFAKKYDVLVFIVAHPTKMNKAQDGEIEEPNMYNIKGGGEWYDASYHGLLVHRNYQEKTVKVKVLKVKFQNLGQNNEEAIFTWDNASGLFIPKYMAEVEKLPWE